MATETTELRAEHRPIAHPLPPVPPSDFFSPLAWETLWALLDGILPSISARPSPNAVVLKESEFDALLDRAGGSRTSPASSKDELRGYFEGRWTDELAFREDVVRMLALSPAKGKLADLLEKLNTRTGSLALTGHWTPVTHQPTAVRQSIMQSWHSSYFVTLRSLAKSLTQIGQKAMCSVTPALPRLSGYADVPRGWAARPGHPFEFVQPPAGDGVHVVETDVVVVGSGCGGGVCAKNLSDAGFRVLVVDKGYHFPPSQLPMTQSAGCQYLFDNGGLYLTEDSSISILAGGAWGGGGTVNWSVCLRPQDHVRKEWAGEGLTFFAGKDFDDCLDRVWDFVGAGTSAIRHNHRNRVVLDGCRKLGYEVGEAAQNTAGQEHYCGQCHLGCGSGEKRGPAVSWLPAAAEAGAEFMEGYKVDKVVFAEDGVTAVGVEGEWVSRGEGGSVSAPREERVVRRVRVKANKVIISSGTFWSPVILMNSGIENPQLGQNLHLHPASTLTATYGEDTSPWEGGIITSYCSEFDNLDGQGHGAKLETTCMVPYTALSNYPWRSGQDYKLFLLKFPRLASFISLIRDRDTGSVFRDRATGHPRVKYTVSDFDREHGLEGTIALCKVCYATGATEIQPYFPGLEPWVAPADGRPTSVADGEDPEFKDKEFAKWLSRVRSVGNKPPVGVWSSAHQMGTCRMATSPEKGVVDGRGKVWGREGLYVADGSVFPSASGVNPMITIMAISDWISKHVAEDLVAGEQ